MLYYREKGGYKMSTEAKRASNARYLAKLKTVSIRLQPEEAESIQQAAEAAGESLSGYIKEAAIARAERKNAKPTD